MFHHTVTRSHHKRNEQQELVALPLTPLISSPFSTTSPEKKQINCNLVNKNKVTSASTTIRRNSWIDDVPDLTELSQEQYRRKINSERKDLSDAQALHVPMPPAHANPHRLFVRQQHKAAQAFFRPKQAIINSVMSPIPVNNSLISAPSKHSIGILTPVPPQIPKPVTMSTSRFSFQNRMAQIKAERIDEYMTRLPNRTTNTGNKSQASSRNPFYFPDINQKNTDRSNARKLGLG